MRDKYTTIAGKYMCLCDMIVWVVCICRIELFQLRAYNCLTPSFPFTMCAYEMQFANIFFSNTTHWLFIYIWVHLICLSFSASHYELSLSLSHSLFLSELLMHAHHFTRIRYLISVRTYFFWCVGWTDPFFSNRFILLLGSYTTWQ